MAIGHGASAAHNRRLAQNADLVSGCSLCWCWLQYVQALAKSMTHPHSTIIVIMGKKKGNQHRTFANYSKWPHLLIF